MGRLVQPRTPALKLGDHPPVEFENLYLKKMEKQETQ
jgi:hypothetical protein